MPPGIDDERMAKCLAAVLVLSALCRGEHIAPVLDSPGAVEHMPVGLAGLFGECGRYGKKRAACLGQRPIERGEPQVVADAQSKPAPWQVGHGGDLAGTIAARFAVAFPPG